MTIDDEDTLVPHFRQMLNKVPEVTIYFWLIKVLSTTVGETAADFLNVDLHLGLTGTMVAMVVLLAAVLTVQFRTKKYVPWVYWLAVVLISIVGTLITDSLVDNLGVPLEIATVVFAVLLVGTFTAWYRSERTLSIHTIVTSRREAFYWAAILFTFALGTAAGDLLAEGLALGYRGSILIFAGLIAVIAAASSRSWLSPILAFWLAYILTRPLGASLGDYLSQAPDDGGLGLGAVFTSALFLATILGLVAYLGVTKRDVSDPHSGALLR
ncbi:hypothetical protein ACFYPW_00220 [Micromonospora zamorensis]|uniref:COG4705 family protein n=1 Tax=Micromonospora zamorensis TaxID=709883 RepID=UPI003695BB9D